MGLKKMTGWWKKSHRFFEGWAFDDRRCRNGDRGGGRHRGQGGSRRHRRRRLAVVNDVGAAGNDGASVGGRNVALEAILIADRSRGNVEHEFAGRGDVEVGGQDGRVQLNLEDEVRVSQWSGNLQEARKP